MKISLNIMLLSFKSNCLLYKMKRKLKDKIKETT